ncbi:MAG: dethiobiotin synthetase [Lentimonas sp.]|jgi:dethiobiotin synthetase
MQIFISGTGTDIGKTFILERICKELISEGKKVRAIKPIISGFKDDDCGSDSAKIIKFLDLELNKENLDKISPYRFSEPLSPNIAANIEGREINFSNLVKFCQNEINLAKENGEYLLIEGAGGVMTPINNDKTFLDLIKELQIPTILVVGNYLGTISHTLTAIKTIQSSGVVINKIIFNCKEDTLSEQKQVETLRNFTDIEISIENKLL